MFISPEALLEEMIMSVSYLFTDVFPPVTQADNGQTGSGRHSEPHSLDVSEED